MDLYRETLYPSPRTVAMHFGVCTRSSEHGTEFRWKTRATAALCNLAVVEQFTKAGERCLSRLKSILIHRVPARMRSDRWAASPAWTRSKESPICPSPNSYITYPCKFRGADHSHALLRKGSRYQDVVRPSDHVTDLPRSRK